MSKLEMFRSILEYIPAENSDLREQVQSEIDKLVKVKAPNPATVECANEIRQILYNMNSATKKELQEITNQSHQRVAAACNLLEREGFLIIHPKGENGRDYVWYSREL